MSDELQTAVAGLGATVESSGQVMRDAAAELNRLREVNGELLAALKGVVRVSDRATVEYDAARSAIAKAESKPRLRDEGSSREDSFFEPLQR